jgi:signal transduction histidine kinase
MIKIRDSGIRIDHEVLPHIFDLFVLPVRRVDRSEAALGLGLALVKKIVELHGGTIEASSAELRQSSWSELSAVLRPIQGSVALPKFKAGYGAELKEASVCGGRRGRSFGQTG